MDNRELLEIICVSVQGTYLETRLARLEAKARAGSATAEELATLPQLREDADELAFTLLCSPEEVDA